MESELPPPSLRPRDRDAQRAPASAEDLPTPEEVFVAWLLWLPDAADRASAARREIERIDARAPLPPELQRLRAYFVALAEGTEGGIGSAKT